MKFGPKGGYINKLLLLPTTFDGQTYNKFYFNKLKKNIFTLQCFDNKAQINSGLNEYIDETQVIALNYVSNYLETLMILLQHL